MIRMHFYSYILHQKINRILISQKWLHIRISAEIFAVSQAQTQCAESIISSVSSQVTAPDELNDLVQYRLISQFDCAS